MKQSGKNAGRLTAQLSALALALGSQKRWKDRLIDRLEQRNAA